MASTSLKVADAINAVSADVDVADVVDVVADVLTDLGDTVIPGLDNLHYLETGITKINDIVIKRIFFTNNI